MAGLLLLSKMLKPSELSIVYPHIPWKFIHRLMITNDATMPEIAVHIWSCFAEFADQKEIIKLIRPACTLLNRKSLQLSILKPLLVLVQAKEANRQIAMNHQVLGQSLAGMELEPLRVLLTLLESIEEPMDIVYPLALCCQECPTELKFQALNVAAKVLCQVETAPKSAAPLFRSVLKSIFKSKLHTSQQDIVLYLCGMLYARYGSSWLPLSSSGGIMKNEQLLTLMVHSACTEIRIILDETEQDLNETPRVLAILPICYDLVHAVVESLIEQPQVALKLDYDILSSIRVAMSEAFMAVSLFLVERFDLYALEQDVSKIDNRTTMTSLKAYSEWVQEESNVGLDELERLMPYMVQLMDMYFH